MKITFSVFSILCVMLFVGCQGAGGGNENKPRPTPTATATTAPTPAKFSKALETPCGGKLSVSHAYSECGPDGFWHVVQDDYYNCPPVTAFRVADTPTTQACKPTSGAVAAAPNPIGNGYKDFHKDTSCQSPKPLGRTITISVCENGYWVNLTYKLYECLDKSLALTEPPDKTLKTEVQCTNPPPAP